MIPTINLRYHTQAVTEEEAVEEAEFLASAAGNCQIDTPLILVSGHSEDFKGRADALSAADRSACVRAFCETIREAGYTPMIYGDRGWLNDCLDRNVLDDYAIWFAQYNTNITHAGTYGLWRYTSGGKVDGISGYVGLSIRPEEQEEISR